MCFPIRRTPLMREFSNVAAICRAGDLSGSGFEPSQTDSITSPVTRLASPRAMVSTSGSSGISLGVRRQASAFLPLAVNTRHQFNVFQQPAAGQIGSPGHQTSKTVDRRLTPLPTLPHTAHHGIMLSTHLHAINPCNSATAQTACNKCVRPRGITNWQA